MNTLNVKVGQVWKIKESSIRPYRENVLNITDVNGDSFTCKEYSGLRYVLDFLTDHYISS